MRTGTLMVLSILGLAAGRGAQAQTSNPLYYLTTSPYVVNENTCHYQTQDLLIDGGWFETNSPYLAYRVTNLLLPPPFHTTLAPWHVTVYPYYGNEEFSVWVCPNAYGNAVWNCIDGSDNGRGLLNTVTVPAQGGVFYIIVAGSVSDFDYPMCGPYTLVATHG